MNLGKVGADPLTSGRRFALISVVFQDVVYLAVLAGTDLQGQHAGRLQPNRAIALGQRQQAKAGTVAMFWMFVLRHQPAHCLGGRRQAMASVP